MFCNGLVCLALSYCLCVFLYFSMGVGGLIDEWAKVVLAHETAALNSIHTQDLSSLSTYYIVQRLMCFQVQFGRLI